MYKKVPYTGSQSKSLTSGDAPILVLVNLVLPALQPAVDERVEDDDDEEGEEEVEGGGDERVAHPVRQRVGLGRVPHRVLPGQRLKECTG